MNATWILICCCWIAWIGYWVFRAFGTKHTVERGGFMGYRVVAALVFAGLALLGRLLHVSAHAALWRPSLALGVVGACTVAVGLVFSVWARASLGENWSAEVTFKQDHELIESGPYALARHPIYTGLILMALGTAIRDGQAIAFAVVVCLCCALWSKARREEQIMTAHFPDAYAVYRSRVHAVIPFLL